MPDRVAERQHEPVDLLPVRRPDEYVYVTEGAQLGERIEPAQIIALNGHMSDAVFGKNIGERLKINAAVEIARYRAVKYVVELRRDRRCKLFGCLRQQNA